MRYARPPSVVAGGQLATACFSGSARGDNDLQLRRRSCPW